MSNMAIRNNPTFSYPLPFLMRVLSTASSEGDEEFDYIYFTKYKQYAQPLIHKSFINFILQ